MLTHMGFCPAPENVYLFCYMAIGARQDGGPRDRWPPCFCTDFSSFKYEVKVKTENEILFELFFREQSRIKFVLMVTRLW